MNNSTGFTIGFGNLGRTLVFEDPLGSVCFAYDIYPATDKTKGEWALEIGSQPVTKEGEKLECKTKLDFDRVARAREAIKQFTISKGYQIED
jgi:hypothetical protein